MSQLRTCVPFEQYLNAYMTRINASIPVIAGSVCVADCVLGVHSAPGPEVAAVPWGQPNDQPGQCACGWGDSSTFGYLLSMHTSG